MRTLPEDAWLQFLSERDEAALLATVHEQPVFHTGDLPKYPHHHRICDVPLQGQAFRVTRCVDEVSGRAQLYISPTEVPDFETAGVPFSLKGESLRQWIIDECEHPTKGEVTWDA